MSGNKSAVLGIIGIILGACGLGLGAINIINLQSINLQNMTQSNYSARAYRDGNTGQLTSGWVTIYLNAESYDPGNHFNNATYIYDVPAIGKYFITATVTFADALASSPNPYKIGIYVNGVLTSVVGIRCSSDGELSITVSDILSLSAGDDVYARYYNPSGVFLTISGSEYQTFMAITAI